MEFFPRLSYSYEQKGAFLRVIYDFEIRTNFTLSSSVRFITGTYIRCNTCSTILAIRIANSWNNQVMVTSFCLRFWFKIFVYFTFDVRIHQRDLWISITKEKQSEYRVPSLHIGTSVVHRGLNPSPIQNHRSFAFTPVSGVTSAHSYKQTGN